jgi:chromosome partitioning protein
VGKSTLAANLAVLAARDGQDVLLVDGDSQETTMTWAAARGEREGVSTDRVTTVALVGKGVREELRRLKPKYDSIIIDAGARDTTTQRSALTISDAVLLPFAPRGPDLWTIDAAIELIGEIRAVNESLRALALVNRADPIGNGFGAQIGFGCWLGRVWRQPRCRESACRTSTTNHAVTKS